MVDNKNQIMVPAPIDGNAMAQVSSKEFAAKYRPKRECYNFLGCEVGIYLPPYDNTSIYFLKELRSGKKQMLRTTNIRTLHIP